MFFSVITENLNWGILTKNLVTFKRWGHEKPIYGDNCLKRGAWTVCWFKGALVKKRERGGLIPQCTLCFGTLSIKELMGLYSNISNWEP